MNQDLLDLLSLDDDDQEQLVAWSTWLGVPAARTVRMIVRTRLAMLREQRLTFVYFDDGNRRVECVKPSGAPVPPPFTVEPVVVNDPGEFGD